MHAFLIVLSGIFGLGSCTPDLLWPLNNDTYTSEIINNSPFQDRTSGCNIEFAQDMPPDFPNLGVSIVDGDVIDVRIEDILYFSGNDYAFSGWFKALGPDGALFHYRSDDQTGDFNEIKAVLVSQTINLTRNLKTSHDIGISSSIGLNTWYYMSFGIDRSSGKMKIQQDAIAILELDDNFQNDIDIVFPGTLRIGGSFDEFDSKFNGHVTCFAYHSIKHDPPLSESKSQCTMTPPGFYLPICMERNMGMYSSDGTPTSNLRVISTSATCSVFQCGVKCLKEISCRYIQYDLSNDRCKTCYLLTIGAGSFNLINGQVFELEYFSKETN
ncbi:unnamed protein product [Mytilus coruscus]|uniref:Farnesoic acid O-methyl transferase domain-containing protein n=1 Tax=Mytilus coruscus TaxID=42192 RepID=A0A6J8AH35_MYTCO|nr:unnamed protein product [Mytilus coruscus]